MTRLFIFAILLTISARSKPILMDPKVVVQIISKDNLDYQEISIKNSELDFLESNFLKDFNWNWSLEFGLERDKMETLSIIQDNNLSRERFVGALKKKWLTGSRLDLNYSYILQDRESSSTTTNNPNKFYLSGMTLVFEQDLLRNSFGSIDKAKFNLNKNIRLQTQLQSEEALESVILKGLDYFWNTYQNEEIFKELSKLKESYVTLAKSIRQKKLQGFASPGELEQVLAEVENKDFQLKTAEIELLNSKKEFANFLKIPFTDLSQISILGPLSAQTIPAPEISLRNVDSLRALKVSEAIIENKKVEVDVATADTDFNLALVARAGTAGVDESSSKAYQEMTELSKTMYYLGLKLSDYWGSSKNDSIKFQRTQLQAAEVAKVRIRNELLVKQNTLSDGLKLSHQRIRSYALQQELREKSLQEIRKSYQLGRVDIRILIESMNALSSIKQELNRAIADFHNTLYEFNALNDNPIIL